ncbi:PRC-barrel domain-containing protein [Arthrobacter pigmenti]
MISIEQIDNLLQHSGSVMDQRGDRVGQVEQVFVGDESGQPEWVTVKTGLFGHAETFIPLREASMDGGDIRVPYEKNRIKDAPRTASSSGHVEPDEEAELYRYYGLEPGWEPGGRHEDPGRDDAPDVQSEHAGEPARQDSGTPPSRHAGGAYAEGGQHVKRDDSGPEIRNAEGVRLRKYTVTEHVTMSVPVEREHVEVVPDDEGDAQASGTEDPYNSESHGRHPEQG